MNDLIEYYGVTFSHNKEEIAYRRMMTLPAVDTGIIFRGTMYMVRRVVIKFPDIQGEGFLMATVYLK